MKANKDLFNLLYVVFAIYLAVVAGLYFFQHHLIYLPSNLMPSPKEAGVPEMQELQVRNIDEIDLTFWYKPALHKNPTIIYFHGNGGNLSDRGLKIKPYIHEGFGVLLIGYRGYGGNLGKPNEKALYSDARSQLNFLKEQGVYPKDWILYGESLGSGVAVNMAFEIAVENQTKGISTSIGALILEAPFLSLPIIAQEKYPFVPARFMVNDSYDSINKINQIKDPIFIAHGYKDRVIPIKHGKLLFEVSNQPKQAEWIPNAGHNDLYDFGLANLVIKFIRNNINS